jgi:hypothetical protein
MDLPHTKLQIEFRLRKTPTLFQIVTTLFHLEPYMKTSRIIADIDKIIADFCSINIDYQVNGRGIESVDYGFVLRVKSMSRQGVVELECEYADEHDPYPLVYKFRDYFIHVTGRKLEFNAHEISQIIVAHEDLV